MSDALEAIRIIEALNEELVILQNEGKRSWFWKFSCRRKQIWAASGILARAAEKIADLALSPKPVPEHLHDPQ
ncbi:MAG: hypothetical protein E5X86_19785 [Mesorhizobium sp.]|uniref:hypothetical protein n=1 Tax=Mesorhizobium sp. TaxID=1871066 RepID=UPI0011F9E47E|nr:hypothetical protein [Mesorhizobium sp.]TIO15613.1 MAG: hypothetical protein E5X86_19785 [Mesorhizobium sp.]